MNKRLIDLVSEDTKVFKKDVRRVLESCFEQLKIVIEEEGRVPIKNFGVFNLVHRPERPARNPKTMESYPVPEHNAITFSASEKFREQVQED